jgi:hypothetical protein
MIDDSLSAEFAAVGYAVIADVLTSDEMRSVACNVTESATQRSDLVDASALWRRMTGESDDDPLATPRVRGCGAPVTGPSEFLTRSPVLDVSGGMVLGRGL